MKNSSSDQPVLDCFKVQLDLTGTNILIYNEDQSYVGKSDDEVIVSVVIALLKLEPLTKKYVTGYIDDAGVFNLDEIVPDQDW